MPPTPALASRDAFTAFDDNPVKRVSDSPVSTFSVDVDTASYGFVRRLLNRGVLPPSNAVRVEELVN
jgi:Ca-activated chloride channel family protein